MSDASSGLRRSLATPGRSPIAYRQFGSGPGLVILHGMMETSADHVDLARRLSTQFTIYLPDRRGFGDSRPQAFSAGLDAEAGDLELLLAATGARAVMGISVGALISLRALVKPTVIQTAVIFEPPLSVDGSAPLDWIADAKNRLAREDRIGAMVSAMVGAKMGPPAFEKMPFWLLKLITAAFVRIGGPKSPAPYVELAPTLAHDADLVLEAADTHADYGEVATPILLLGADGSPEYFGTALGRLDGVLRAATRVVLEGKDHQVTGNRGRGGDPDAVAAQVVPFILRALEQAR